MIYFYPSDDEWSEYLNENNFNYTGYWPTECTRASSANETIIDRWNTIPIPPPPELTPVYITAKTTALLILDMETTICKDPRCISSISKIDTLLTRARRSRMLVVYSLTPTGNLLNIANQIIPLPGDPIVQSSVDKFYKTTLERMLHEEGIKTVIVTGYAANGAVLHTATSAAFRGYNVIVPVDCTSANNPYAEQYTAWHMLNSPGTRNKAILTKVDLMNFLP
ncbi:isochorismatase [Clostridium zeae]|uniref:Isochorismatase n=1 Tax=Clostridium zeae TaxID=2759022 RepID=A0ABQ1EBY9_9CLOT|nr:cysteine hydrolase [Clostridium zeae]GFZ32327.1 isochorismatase [Clostridium zeae]